MTCKSLLVLLKDAKASLAGTRCDEVIMLHCVGLAGSNCGAACNVMTMVGVPSGLGVYPRSPEPRVSVTRRTASGRLFFPTNASAKW
jgi:hypothetical protein